jgi:HEAT repeat protein
VPALLNALDDSDKNTRRKAADALGCIGQQPDLVVPVLIKLLDNPDMEDIAAKALGDFGDRATHAIPALLTLFQAEFNSLNQPRGQYRSDDIALALNNISPEVAGKEIIPRLIDRIHHAASPWSQSMTLNTLSKMTNQPDVVMPVLLEVLDNPDYYTRNHVIYDAANVVYDLGRFGSAATSAIPRLISLSTSQDTNLCRLARNALDKIDPSWRNHR